MTKRSKSMRKFRRKLGRQDRKPPVYDPRIDPLPDTAPAAAFTRLKEELGVKNWQRWLDESDKG